MNLSCKLSGGECQKTFKTLAQALSMRNNTASIETPQHTRNSFGEGECYEHSKHLPAATVAAIVAAIEAEQCVAAAQCKQALRGKCYEHSEHLPPSNRRQQMPVMQQAVTMQVTTIDIACKDVTGKSYSVHLPEAAMMPYCSSTTHADPDGHQEDIMTYGSKQARVVNIHLLDSTSICNTVGNVVSVPGFQWFGKMSQLVKLPAAFTGNEVGGILKGTSAVSCNKTKKQGSYRVQFLSIDLQLKNHHNSTENKVVLK